MTKYSNEEYLDMIVAFGKYKDFKEACDCYNVSHYPQIFQQTIKDVLERCKEDGQFQPKRTSKKAQGKISKTRYKAKSASLELSSSGGDSESQGESVTIAPTSNSGEASTSSQNMPPSNQISIRDEQDRVEEELHNPEIDTRISNLEDA